MIDLKNWRTDIKVKFPRIHWIRQIHYDKAAESLVSSFIKYCFFSALYGWYCFIRDVQPVCKKIIDLIFN